MNRQVFIGLAIFSTAFVSQAGIFPGGLHFADTPGEWWTMSFAAHYGGLVGAGVGGLAGILGATAGLMVSRGKGRRFIVGAMMAMTVIGLVSLTAGIVALMQSQPWHVTYPLLLLGVILSVVCGSNTLMVRALYRKVEMRQMTAQDL